MNWSKSFKRFFYFLVIMLAFTGFGQMPIFKRYYLADIPGFGWTADFYFNHRFHYVLSMILLLILSFQTGKVLALGKIKKVSFWGWVSILMWIGVVATGIIRVLKNFPHIYFSPTTVVIIDWSHLGFVFLLGFAFLLRKLMRKSYFI